MACSGLFRHTIRQFQVRVPLRPLAGLVSRRSFLVQILCYACKSPTGCLLLVDLITVFNDLNRVLVDKVES